eukprot:NODE_3476_length_550_cov_75.674651_g2938_i0.p3 GENE.NODE_3476_length_550_cov_75.674651_g2938_i0~~NODE_3476_length_550_cov_75.674651_g2938_i0.p3  ORF type:complete len:73 (-),score=11.67 NODE_3476_length_550_cov_75.674651_g2938_i0:85-303(-)
MGFAVGSAQSDRHACCPVQRNTIPSPLTSHPPEGPNHRHTNACRDTAAHTYTTAHPAPHTYSSSNTASPTPA